MQGLTRNICKTRLTQILATAAAVIAYYYPKPWTFPALIVAGGLISIAALWAHVSKVAEVSAGVDRLGFNKWGGGALIAVWVGVLVGVLVGAGQSAYADSRELHWFSAFYRTGSVIFGGGQVVLPMLYNDVVAADCVDQAQRCCPANAALAADPAVASACSAANAQDDAACQCSWMSGNEFYAGLALAQAMPGPLFNFAAYLGAVIAQNAGVFPVVGIVVCWVGLFAPGIILIFAILPFWATFRRWQIYRRCARRRLATSACAAAAAAPAAEANHPPRQRRLPRGGAFPSPHIPLPPPPPLCRAAPQLQRPARPQLRRSGPHHHLRVPAHADRLLLLALPQDLHLHRHPRVWGHRGAQRAGPLCGHRGWRAGRDGMGRRHGLNVARGRRALPAPRWGAAAEQPRRFLPGVSPDLAEVSAFGIIV